MTASTSTLIRNETYSADTRSAQTRLYRLGGVLALLIVMTALLEIIITFLPGGYASADTVLEWFTLFQNNWFLGLRNLGLLNIVMTTLGIPMFFALYTAHRETCQPYTTLALLFSLLGSAVFFATNRAFPMLDLSRQYAQVATDAERTLLAAAGQAMLSVGESHTPGTFLGFFLSEIAGILISLVMLRSRTFPVINAHAGIFGFGMLLIFDICTSFVPALSNVVLIFAMIGGLLSIAWYILISLRLFQLARPS
ncbi:MAG TPA: hypothetical protein VLT51_04760 [Anaerolineales bacterium]|nr:hypothetical protein [Anaerolineales bacterium]